MADKKLFTLSEAAIDGTMKIAMGKSGVDSKNATLNTLCTWVQPASSTLLTKVVEIGGFDMQRNTGTACHDMGLGVTKSKVRNIDVTILTNDGACMSPILHPRSDGETGSGWHMICASASAVIRLFSRQDSFFNHSAFNDEGLGCNRGFVTVRYIA